MRFDNLARAFGQALGEALSENGKFQFRIDDDERWQSLGELDLSGSTADRLKVALGNGDTVRVENGERLGIEIEGDDTAQAALRFRLDDEALRIARKRGSDAGPLAIRVTMPQVRTLSIGGGGTIESETLTGDAAISIGGSGTVRVANLAADSLSAKIGGSGTIAASGAVSEFSLKIGGSGRFDGADVEIERARIAIGGSGRAEFACDGEVDAKIGGSGDILVYGSPRCSLKAGGSGRLQCIPRGGDTPLSQAA